MTWQRPARIGVAVFGIGVAFAVYWAAGERPVTTTPDAIERLDPKAVIESSGARLQQERGTERDFEVTSQRQLYYEDGSSALFGVSIVVRGRAGRDFVLTGREARATGKQDALRITGAVTLAASDGLTVKADEATFNQERALVEAPGAVTFTKGRMAGSGQGMSYDEAGDVLTLIDQASVVVTSDDPTLSMDLKAGGASLKRLENVLEMDRQVHVLRGGQTIEADRATARLSDPDNQVTFLELRGQARVSGGGGGLDAMTAQDIDLDYSDDGSVLERVRLAGNGALVMRGTGASPGRQLAGDTIEVTVAPDGAVTGVQGREDVRFNLPAAADQPARTVTARSLDGIGEAGKGLTSARFAGSVDYREAQARQGSAGRRATADTLQLGFDGDDVTEAMFKGRSRFSEGGLDASAAEARYRPDGGTLRLSGVDGGGPPHVADERIDVIAEDIDLTLMGRRLNATRSVKTTLRANAPGDQSSRGDGVLLDNDRPAFVNASALQYRGADDTAVYSGGATLWQGDTSIRADRIVLDRRGGDLQASGAARANIDLDGGGTTGRAEEIRYTRSTRMIAYSGAPKPATSNPTGRGPNPPTRGGAPGAPSVQQRQVQLNGPQGDLQADRIDVVLDNEGEGIERLDAFVDVTARVDSRTATGARLTYVTAEERYTMSGEAMPVKVVDTCRTTTGRTLVFFKSSDRILVDGNDLGRTQTTSKGDCPAGDR